MHNHVKLRKTFNVVQKQSLKLLGPKTLTTKGVKRLRKNLVTKSRKGNNRIGLFVVNVIEGFGNVFRLDNSKKRLATTNSNSVFLISIGSNKVVVNDHTGVALRSIVGRSGRSSSGGVDYNLVSRVLGASMLGEKGADALLVEVSS